MTSIIANHRQYGRLFLQHIHFQTQCLNEKNKLLFAMNLKRKMFCAVFTFSLGGGGGVLGYYPGSCGNYVGIIIYGFEVYYFCWICH